MPQEYGTTIAEKRSIGSKMCNALLEKIKNDLIVARTDNQVDMRYMINMDYSADLSINTLGRRIRTRLYFTSESHLHTLLNVLRYQQDDQNPIISKKGQEIIANTPELCYLTQIVLRLFEDPKKELHDKKRFRVEIFFSPGATATPLHMAEMYRDLDNSRFDTAPLECISNEYVTCDEIETHFDDVMKQANSATISSSDETQVPLIVEQESKQHHVVSSAVTTDKTNEPLVAHEQTKQIIPPLTPAKELVKQITLPVTPKTADHHHRTVSRPFEKLDDLLFKFKNPPQRAVTTNTSIEEDYETSSNLSDFLIHSNGSHHNHNNEFIIEEKVNALANSIACRLLRRFFVLVNMTLLIGLTWIFVLVFHTYEDDSAEL